MNAKNLFALIVALLPACAELEQTETQAQPEPAAEAVAPPEQAEPELAAEPAADLAAPELAETELAAAVELSPAEEFMAECLAGGEEYSVCAGLYGAWHLIQIRTDFLECCVAGGLELGQCRQIWLSQTQAWTGERVHCLAQDASAR
jgi:hypothetical protein